MGHLREVGDALRPIKVLACASVILEGELMNSATRSVRAAQSSVDVRSALRCHGRLAGDALDQDGLRLQRQTEVLCEPRDPAVFDARLGLNSYVVTTGPGLICVMRPPISNSWHFCSMARAQSLRSSSSILSLRLGHPKQFERGQPEAVAPLAMRGEGAAFAGPSSPPNANTIARECSTPPSAICGSSSSESAFVPPWPPRATNWRTPLHFDLLEPLAHPFLFAILAPRPIALLQRTNDVQFAHGPRSHS